MKKLFLFGFIALSISCSAPKQYYMFRHSPTPTPDREQVVEEMMVREVASETSSPVILDDAILESQVAEIDPVAATVAVVEEPEVKVLSAEEFKAMSRSEKKEIRKEIRNYVKDARTNSVEAVQSTQDFEMTGYTRIGVILAAAGVVLLVLTSGTVAALGGLLVLAGVIFVLIDIL